MLDDNRPMDFAKDKNSATLWAKKRKQVWLNNLSKAESTSINNYIKNSSEINSYSIKKKFALDNYEGIETLNEDLKNISTAVKKSMLTKPLYVYYYEANDKFGFNQNLESSLDSNIIDEEAINNFAKKISDTNFIQDGFSAMKPLKSAEAFIKTFTEKERQIVEKVHSGHPNPFRV